MKLSSNQRKYLLFGQCFIPLVINFFLNGMIGLLMFRGMHHIPTHGFANSVAGDLIGTCFFLPAITCLIVTPIVRYQIKTGVVHPILDSPSPPKWLRLFRAPLLLRALLFGLTGLALFGSLTGIVLFAAAPDQLDIVAFLWVKALFSAGLGAVVTPIIAVTALTEVA